MLRVKMNQLFTLRRIVAVEGESHIDCVVLTFVAPLLWVTTFLGIIWACYLGI